MLTDISPKLPMREKSKTQDFYLKLLGFKELGDYGDYLIVAKDYAQIHFFEFKEMDPKKDAGQVYIRTDDIERLYQSIMIDKTIGIHPAGHLAVKPWGQKEFSIVDPDNNLLTFGQNTSDRLRF